MTIIDDNPVRLGCDDRAVFDMKYVAMKSQHYSRVKRGEAAYHTVKIVRDYDGTFDQWQRVEEVSRNQQSPSWFYQLHYHDAYGETFDFQETGQISTTTAYRYGSASSPSLISFSLSSLTVGPETYLREQHRSEISLSTVRKTLDEVSRLKNFYEGLDEASGSLDAWADSGYSMTVQCISGNCSRYENVVRSDKLHGFAKQGISLEALVSRLKCSKCKQRKVRVSISD